MAGKKAKKNRRGGKAATERAAAVAAQAEENKPKAADGMLHANAKARRAATRKTKKGPEVTRITIPEPRFEGMGLGLHGRTRIVTNCFDEKTRWQLLMRQGVVGDPPLKVERKPKRDPEDEYLRSMYPVPGMDGVYGFPAIGVKKAIATTAKRFYGINKVLIYGALWIDMEIIPILDASGKPKEPVRREDYVRLKGIGNPPDVRFRASFETPWKVQFPVRYDADILDPEAIVRLLCKSGYAVGLGEFRTEKGGDWGMFDVKALAGKELDDLAA